MDELFSHLVFWHWFALAVVLGILDVTLGANFFFVWCGVSAVLVGILKLMFASMTWEYQFLIFGIGVMASLVIWRMYLSKHRSLSDKPSLNKRSAQYIGRTFTLEEAIVNGRGKVRVDDTLWLVTGEELPAGTVVKVISVDGTVLKVQKV